MTEADTISPRLRRRLLMRGFVLGLAKPWLFFMPRRRRAELWRVVEQETRREAVDA